LLAPTFLSGCGPAAPNTTAPSSFLLTCTKAGAAAMVLRMDTGSRRFAVVNADGAPGGVLLTQPYAYSLTTAAWAAKVNRYDGQLVLTRAPPKSTGGQAKTPVAWASPETWSCTRSADKAKF
jgi:hypothetical protein